MATAAVPRERAELSYRWTLNLLHLSVTSWVRILSLIMDNDLTVVLIDQSAQVGCRRRAWFFFLSSVGVNEFIVNFICLRIQISLLFNCLVLLILHFIFVILRLLRLWGYNFNVVAGWCRSAHCLSLLWISLFEQLSTGDILFLVSLAQPGTISVMVAASVRFLSGIHSCFKEKG